MINGRLFYEILFVLCAYKYTLGQQFKARKLEESWSCIRLTLIGSARCFL